MDTRFWGPSGWELLHRISFQRPILHDTEGVLYTAMMILPCKYCRESVYHFIKEIPYTNNPSKWLYDIHNRVNDKLRIQSHTDKKVKDPGPDPTFEAVKHKYTTTQFANVAGRDFLYSIVVNYHVRADQILLHHRFLTLLSHTYPDTELRDTFVEYIRESDLKNVLENKTRYLKWMYGLLAKLSQIKNVEIPTYEKYLKYVSSFRSNCKKTITCRTRRTRKI